MPRIRSIKPEFFTSEAVAELSVRARMTWIGLWTHCDDEGRCKDNPRLVHAALYPLDENITPVEVAADLAELAARGRIERYVVGGRRYLQVTNWKEHQKPNRPQGSKLPGPDQADTSSTEPSVQHHGSFTDNSVNTHAPVTTGVSTDHGPVDTTESDQNPATPHQHDGIAGQAAFTESSVNDQCVLTARSSGAVEQWSSGAVEQRSARAPARTRSTTTLAELNATAAKPAAWTIVNEWRGRQPYELRTATVRQLQQRVDAILSDRGDPDAIRDALDTWAQRSDAGPGLLPSLYDDAQKARHGARPGGRPTRGDKVNGWLALDEDSDAAQPTSARGDKVRGWLDLDDSEESDSVPALTAITGGKSA